MTIQEEQIIHVNPDSMSNNIDEAMEELYNEDKMNDAHEDIMAEIYCEVI